MSVNSFSLNLKAETSMIRFQGAIPAFSIFTNNASENFHQSQINLEVKTNFCEMSFDYKDGHFFVFVGVD